VSGDEVGEAATVAIASMLQLPGPLDIPGSLELFRRSGDDLIDRWNGTTLARTARSGDRIAAYIAAPSGSVEAPAILVSVEHPGDLPVAVDQVKRTFVPAPPEFADLLAADPIIAGLEARYPGVRPVRQFDLFSALVRGISAQQVNLRWAVTTRRRLAETFGERHEIAGHAVYTLPAERLSMVNPADLRALQFTTRKAEYIVHAAQAIAGGQVSVEQLAALPDEEVIARLSALRGIGRWTAEWILARTLGRPTVVAGDLGVRKAVGMAYLGAPLPSEAEVRRATAHWGASAGVAQQLLLHALGEGASVT
jgi:DNA-3-methyladenine glycosylase II